MAFGTRPWRRAAPVGAAARRPARARERRSVDRARWIATKLGLSGAVLFLLSVVESSTEFVSPVKEGLALSMLCLVIAILTV